MITNKRKKYLKKIFSKKELLYLPGELAFSLIFALVPTISLVVAICSKINISTNFIYNYLEATFSNDTAGYIVDVINNSSFTIPNILLIIVALVVSSNGFNAIIVSSDHMYNIKSTPFLRRKIKAIFLNVFFFLLILFILFVPVFGKLIIKGFSIIIKGEQAILVLTQILGYLKWPFTFILVLLFTKLIYTLSPNEIIPSKYLNKGSLFTTIGFMLLTVLYSVYVNNIARYDLLYGNFSNIIILLLWLYLMSYIFVLGLAINEDDYKDYKDKV